MSLPYRTAVGKLTYAATGTRPDVAFAVSYASRFLSAYSEEHWTMVKRILRYLQGTAKFGLIYDRNDPQGMTLVGYCDSDWGGDKGDRKSTSGYLYLLCGGPVSWSSKKQSTIAVSSTEAEYLAATQATKEALWLRRLLSELGYEQTTPTIIKEDNQGCIKLTKNPVFHARTKHFDIQHHFVREHVEKGNIELEYCPTNEMIADMLTKALARNLFAKFVQAIGLHHPVAP